MSTLPGHDHMSNYTPFLDGKGGTDSVALVGKSTKGRVIAMVRPIPKTRLLASTVLFTHTVYYRLYTKLGAFESNRALYNDNRSIGRIPPKSFALLITWRLFNGPCAHLRTFRNPTRRLSSHRSQAQHPKKTLPAAPSGPGLSEQDPIALVVESEKRSDEVS